MFKKFEHKRAIKHEIGDPLDFLITSSTPSTPIKKSGQNPKDPPPPISNYCASVEFEK
jgi:hypothetical protein